MSNIKPQPVSSLSSLYDLALDSASKIAKTTKEINNLLLSKKIKKDLLYKHITTRILKLADACKYRKCHDIEFTNIDITTLIQQNFKVSPDLLTRRDYKRLNNLMGVLLESEDRGLVELGIELLKNNKTEANIKKFFLCVRQLLSLDVNDIISNLQYLFVNDTKIEKRIIGYLISYNLRTQYYPDFRNEAKKNKILDIVNYFLTNNNSKLTIDTATNLLYCLEVNHDIAQTARTRILQHYESQLQNKEVYLTKVSSSEDCLQQLPQQVITRLTNVVLPIDKQLKLNSVIMSQLNDTLAEDKAIYYQKNSNEIFNLTSITKCLTNIKNKTNIYCLWIKKYELVLHEITTMPFRNTPKIVDEFKFIICFLLNHSEMYSKAVYLKLQIILKELSFSKDTPHSIIIDKLKQIIANEGFIKQKLESFISADTTIALNIQKLNAKIQELKIVFDKTYIFDPNISIEQLLEIHGFINIKTELLNKYFWNNIFLKANKIKYCLIKRAYGKSGVCTLENYDDIKALISYKTKLEKAVVEFEYDKKVQLEKDIIKTVLDPNALVITRIELKQVFDDFINSLAKSKDSDEADTD